MIVRIFDFDGVICDSNNIKTQCLKKSVEKNLNYQAAIDFEKHHKLNGGVSRYIKFKRIIDKYSGNQKIYDDMLLDAEIFLKKEFIKLKMVKNAKSKLKEFSNIGDKLYIASGGKQDEIIDLCNRWLISNYFEGIFGSPRKKIDICKDIKEKNPNSKIKMYGDSKYDYDSAKSIGAEFFFMSRYADSIGWFQNNMGTKLFSFEEIY
tara:strand:+ start:852 stop:1469 length:618 start_codon:yes stop_codon:yes gene_type:complete